MIKNYIIGLLCVALVFVSGFFFQKDKRTAFIYPNGTSDSSNQKIKEGFTDLKECIDYAVSFDNGLPSFDYECGSNCRKSGSYGDFYRCDETLDTFD